ncbi:toprim domain-containing protein [Serratia marcescens]|uniref:toprim domain-containing protein n=1 Tax=Serratia marcescens TaxID=615 RepID=UPI0007453227|nr:toprim domain-containing protein [Serratia marcescens]MDP8622257.1 toprim domain-containing protein [Serratia marcescens]TWY30482.1 AAA family ATPase [Serratia marcescens]CVA06743.1 DNA primase (bacterial type) [Serratia marcescens]CVD61628.1 DNA primase (bacterial type) [Serratia marcescens]HEJ7814904.1 toprim domain-containing protein [Serratia marcescens]
MNAAELSEKLWGNAERVVKYLLPNGHREAHEWCCGSINGEAGKSLKVNLAGKNVWSDFASGDSGDLLDLWVLVRNCSLHEAMREAKEMLGLKDNDQHFQAKKKSFSKPKKQGVKKGDAHLQYLAGRGITKETAEAFKVSNAVVWFADEGRELPAIAFPYLRDGELLQVKRISTERPNGKKIIMAEADCEPCLFGWQALPKDTRVVVLCEGEIDCMSYAHYGFPVLSVPFGGGKGAKQQWIEYEYHNMDRFDEIWLSLDNDEVGMEAAKEIARRLGTHRCRLVSLPHKDINECLVAGMTQDEVFRCLETAAYFDPDELCSASEFLQDTIDTFERRDEGMFISPWTRLNGNFKFRESEFSIINGINNHGKTEMAGHIAVCAMDQGIRTCIASLELKPGKLLARLVRQVICNKRPQRGEIQHVFEWFDDKLWIFNLTGTAKADRLLEIFAYARRRYGIDLFVIDNLAKCGFSEEDATGQKDFIDKLCDFKNTNNCHVILVTHSRKVDENVPTGKMDVKGTGAITDMADNLFSVWRNIPRETAQQKQDDPSAPELTDKDRAALALPGTLIRLLKQREGEGWVGDIGAFLEPRSHQFLENEKGSPWNYLVAREQAEVDMDWEMQNVTRAC